MLFEELWWRIGVVWWRFGVVWWSFGGLAEVWDGFGCFGVVWGVSMDSSENVITT